MALDGFEGSIAGKWLLVRNENFDEYLAANGIGYIKRKLAGAMSTTMELRKVGDKKIRIITKGAKNIDMEVELDVDNGEKDPFDNKITAKVTWDPMMKVMRTEAWPCEGSNGKHSIVKRQIIGNDELFMEVTLPNDNIVCKRYFKRQLYS